jgi:hypothetical protein
MTSPGPEQGFSAVVVTLLKGVTYAESDPRLWQDLLALSSRVRDYVGHLGLELVLDEAEGYAFVRQRPTDDADDARVPRLVPRRQLGYAVSLLLALLRKKLAEFDAQSGETRLVLGKAEILEIVRLFLPDQANEAKLMDRVETQLGKVVDMGFLRRLPGDQFEVRRILKSFVDAQWLADFDERLAIYREHAESAADEPKKKERRA